jgi:hypothetical protein
VEFYSDYLLAKLVFHINQHSLWKNTRARKIKDKVFVYLRTIFIVILTKYSNTINIVFLILMYKTQKVEFYSVFVCVERMKGGVLFRIRWSFILCTF